LISLNENFGKVCCVDYSNSGESWKELELNHKFMIGKKNFWKKIGLERRKNFLKENKIWFEINFGNWDIIQNIFIR